MFNSKRIAKLENEVFGVRSSIWGMCRPSLSSRIDRAFEELRAVNEELDRLKTYLKVKTQTIPGKKVLVKV